MTSPEGGAAQGEQVHAGDALFAKLGLPDGFGDIEIEDFHGRPILRKDYFFQPETDPQARHVFDILSTLPETDPRFEPLKAIFLQATERYLNR